MKVRYSPQATRDIASIHEYLAERSPKGAANVMAAIYASVEFIKQYPRGAELTNIVGVYGKLVSKYHFKVYYRIAGNRRHCRDRSRSAHVATTMERSD
jgi:plasmid stabilization system protein ParE